MSNKATFKSYGYFPCFLHLNFWGKWILQLCPKLPSFVQKPQGILGVKCIYGSEMGMGCSYLRWWISNSLTCSLHVNFSSLYELQLHPFDLFFALSCHQFLYHSSCVWAHKNVAILANNHNGLEYLHLYLPWDDQNIQKQIMSTLHWVQQCFMWTKKWICMLRT
jgi:hypothetical protein